MIAAILNSANLHSAILIFPAKLTHTCFDWSHHWHKKNFTHTFLPTICIKNFTHSFWLNLMMAAILNSFILDSSILLFSIKLTHTWLDWSHYCHKKNFTHSTWQNSRWLPLSSWVRMNESSSSWVRKNKWRLFCAKCLNPRWQNWRWLPSSSWVRMNKWSFFVQMLGTNLGRCKWVWEEKLRWLSLSQIELVWVRFRVEWEGFWVNLRRRKQGVWIQDGSVWIQHGRIQDGCHHQVKWEWMNSSQIELVWVRVRMEWEVWVFLSDSKRRKQGVFIQDGSGWIQHGRIQDGCHHQVESEWISEVFCANGGEWSVSELFLDANGGTNLIKCEWVWHERLRWMNPRWKNSRWLPSSSWVRMNEWSFLCKWWGGKCEWSFFCAIGGTNLSECEWVWQEKLRWLNTAWQNSRWLPSSSSVRMNGFESDWIRLSQTFVQNGWIQYGCHHQVNQIELVWVRIRVQGECFGVNLREDNKVSESKMAVSESNMAEFKMAAIIKLSQNEWVKVFLGVNSGNQSWQVWVSLKGKTKMAESKMAIFRMTAIIKLSENEWVWVRLN